MTTRTPIDWTEIRVGDVVECEAYGMTTRLTVRHLDSERVYAAHGTVAPEGSMLLKGHRWFLLERPVPPDDAGRHLPDEPTLGWAVVEEQRTAGVWCVKRWRSPIDGSDLVTLLQREIELVASQVDDFIEGELVPKASLDALVLAHPPRLGRVLDPVDHFLRVVRGDR